MIVMACYNIILCFSGDSLDHSRGFPFSTYDNDHNNCSLMYKGAWWYNYCHNSNLNGLYGSTNFGQGVTWFRWHGQSYSLKTTEMKIKRM